MSALGQKPTCAVQNGMSALPLKADMCGAKSDVRFVPIAEIGIFIAAVSHRILLSTSTEALGQFPDIL